MYDLFISYAREDEDDFARPLYLALSNLKLNVWLDEEKLVLGKPCKEDIRKAIEESNYGIALLTENYFKEEKEESTLYELRLFKKKLEQFGGFILPVVCGHVEHILKTEEYSFLDKPTRTDWNKGIITVIKWIVKGVRSELLNSNIELLIYRDPPIPKNQHDASVLIRLYKDAGRNEEASEFALKYLKQHPKDSTILNFYVNSVEATNNAYLIANAIGRIYDWFKEKPDDQGVREKFMNFAKRRVKHAEWVIEDMSEWLINNHSINLIVSYLSLVFERGTTEQVERAINEGKKWLLEKDSSPVRVPYFNLVVKRGNQEQKKEILKETMLWLDENQKDRILRTIYYKYIKDQGDLKQKQDAIEWCEKWLDGNKNNNFLIPTYLDLVEDFKNKKYIDSATDYTQNWLNLRHNYKDKRVRERFIKFMRTIGNPEEIAKVIKETKDWLEDTESTKLNTENVRVSLLKLIEEKGTPEQFAEEINNILKYLKKHESSIKVRASLLDLVEERCREEPLKDSLFKDYMDWLNRNKGDIEVRRRFLDHISKVGNYDQKMKVIYESEIWLNDHDNFKVKQSLKRLKMPLSEKAN